MDIVVSGASGLIGSALVPALRADGHTVRQLVRRAPTSDDELQWDPAKHEVDADVLASADAVINLNGVGIGDKRWDAAYKKLLVDSRVDSTATIVEAITRPGSKVRVLINGSAIGGYGERGADEITEEDPLGDGFLENLVRQWEAAAEPAAAAGIRVVRIRTGIVLSPQGGALKQMLLPFKLGVGGRLASGKQYMSWISIADEIAAIKFALTNESVSGPLNLTAPNPVTNRELTKALGRALHRPTFAAVPKSALRIAFGEFADTGLLISQRVLPKALLDAGFGFSDPTLDGALAAVL